jgi:hypothetical protein
MKKTIPLTLAIIFLCSTGRADIATEKRAEIEKLLRLTGTERLMGQMANQLIASFKVQMPQVPETFWTKFQQKMNTREMIDLIIPVYDKYYTLEDLKAVNAFYETPAGQKVLSTLPQLMQETMRIGQEWGQKMGKQAAEEAEQEMKDKSATHS